MKQFLFTCLATAILVSACGTANAGSSSCGFGIGFSVSWKCWSNQDCSGSHCPNIVGQYPVQGHVDPHAPHPLAYTHLNMTGKYPSVNFGVANNGYAPLAAPVGYGAYPNSYAAPVYPANAMQGR